MRQGSFISTQSFKAQQFYRLVMADARDYLRSLEDQLDASMTREECMQLRAKIVRVRATIRAGELLG